MWESPVDHAHHCSTCGADFPCKDMHTWDVYDMFTCQQCIAALGPDPAGDWYLGSFRTIQDECMARELLCPECKSELKCIDKRVVYCDDCRLYFKFPDRNRKPV